MSLVVPSKFQKTELSEREAWVRHGREKAQKDFAQEEAENLIKESYAEELHRLRKGGPPVSQPKPALHSNPPKSKGPSPMQRQLDLERSARASMRAQVPFVPDSKPAAPSPEISEADGQFAVKVIETWKASVEAKKDFPNVVSFHAFCVECEEREIQLRPHQKGIVGLPFYQRSINLQKSPGSCR